jgi:CheY-like chemotaxis protein
LARKILLADDSVTAQNMGRKILADAGYDVVTVNNGSAALKRIAEMKPDLIVLDVYMPGYSGLEVCQRLKDAAETAHIPVLLTVGKLEPFKADEARRVRADAHIVKPFEASELLTAITRLEDRMVPQQSEGARFSGEGSGRKAESDAEADTGWKSRLRFPSKKKKEEPEPEDVAAGATFRDFRKGKGKTGASAAFTVKAPSPGQEPGQVPDIPRDITPEELDALSALAAKLDGPIPAAENIAPPAEETETKIGPVEAPAAELAVARTEVEVPAAAAEANKEVETQAPVVEPAAAAVEATALAVEAPASAIEGKNEVEIPVEHMELAAEGATEVADPPAVEIHQYETQHPETPAAVVAVAVNTVLLAQEPAPVDRNDEPLFASAASVVEQAAEDKAEEKIEGKPAEAVAQIETSETSEASAPQEAVAEKGLESKPEESKAQELNVEELKAEKTAPPVAASAQEAAEAEEPAPSDVELAEALRLLTPATGHADVSTVPSHGTLVTAGQLLAEEAARNAAAGPRWVAEPVTLSPEEAAISLEAEMFRTFAAMPAAISAATSGGEIESVRITGVSAIAAAVENRLAEAELAASAKAFAEQGDERRSAEHRSETTSAETSAAESPAEVTAAVSKAASSLVDGMEAEIATEKIALEKSEPEKREAEQKDSAAEVAEEAPAEEVAAATFADAVGQDEVEATAEQNGEPVSGTTAAVAEENQDSSSDSGSRESMGRDVKGKSGKSNWHQIHTASASSTASSDVETAKQAEHVAQEAPKAMAAAAAAEGGTASASATDARTIASIVDSVLADLRPKIVEEITRKLAGK